MTRLHLAFCIVVIAGAVVIPSASAAVITVDGNMSEWGTGSEFYYWHDGDDSASTGNSGNVRDNYDINYNCWTIGNLSTDAAGSDPTTLFIGMKFIKDFAGSGLGAKVDSDFAVLVFDTVTGGHETPLLPGIFSDCDFYTKWDVASAAGTTAKDLVWYKWDSTHNAWAWKAGGTREAGDSGIWAAWTHDTVNHIWTVEYQIPLKYLWASGEAEAFGWAGYYDNGTTSADDICPGEDEYNHHDIPEPGSFALFGLGLMGLMAFRRRRNADK
jgi:hypothetical protein